MDRFRFITIVGLLSTGLLFPVRHYLNRNSPKISQMPASGDGNNVSPPRVVQIHHADVCNWKYGKGSYIDFIDYNSVKMMMSAGLMAFTGADSPVAAWRKIIQPYKR